MKTHRMILSLLGALASVACAASAGSTVILDDEGVRNLGIETVTVEQADFEVTTFALGWTEAIPENRSVLSSRIPGRVIENRIEIGEFVEKGDKLLLVESLQPGNPPPSVWLTAPADGNILTMNTVLGAPVDPADKLAELADLRRIYLVVMLPQSTAGKIVQGTQARVRFPLRPDIEYTAMLRQHAVCACPNPACALGLDMSTRKGEEEKDANSAGVVFTLENEHTELRPQMFAECHIILEKREGVLSVPREAVHGGPGERHVFIKHHSIPNAFDRVNVVTGAAGNGRIEIVDGLFDGDEVVTRGSYSLGFVGNSGGMSLKEAMDIAHGHEHNEDGSEITDGDDHADHAHEGEDHDHADHDDHAHGADHGISPFELVLMIVSAVLAVTLVLVLMSRRGGSDLQPTN